MFVLITFPQMRSLSIILLFYFLGIQLKANSQVYNVDINYVKAWKKMDSLRRHHMVKESFSLNKKKIDSIQRLISLSPDDTVKVNRLLLVSSIQMEIGVDAPTTTFALQAYSLAEKLHFKKILTPIFKELGNIYAFRKDFKTAIQYYQRALDLTEKDLDNSKSIDLYAVLLNSYFYLADYPHAMETISREMTIAEKLNDKKRVAHCNNILGYIHFKQEDFEEAEKYYTRYINIARELNDSVLLAHALGEMADVYINEKKYSKSIKILFNTLQICDQMFLDRKSLGLETNYKAKALYRLSRAYKLYGDLPKALHYSQEAFKLVPVDFTDYEIAGYYINAGDVYKELNEYKKAIDYLRYGFTLSKDIQHRENTRDAARYLS